MPARRYLSLLTVTLPVAVLLAGCSTDPVEATPAVHAEDKLCAKAAMKWPTQVGNLQPYPVTTPSDSVRAWGSKPDNAVIARCGVDSPAPTTDSCIQVDDVDWVQSSITGGHRFVTYGRTPAVEVLIPSKTSSTPGLLLPAFTSTARTIPQGSHRCV